MPRPVPVHHWQEARALRAAQGPWQSSATTTSGSHSAAQGRSMAGPAREAVFTSGIIAALLHHLSAGTLQRSPRLSAFACLWPTNRVGLTEKSTPNPTPHQPTPVTAGGQGATRTAGVCRHVRTAYEQHPWTQARRARGRQGNPNPSHHRTPNNPPSTAIPWAQARPRPCMRGPAPLRAAAGRARCRSLLASDATRWGGAEVRRRRRRKWQCA